MKGEGGEKLVNTTSNNLSTYVPGSVRPTPLHIDNNLTVIDTASIWEIRVARGHYFED